MPAACTTNAAPRPYVRITRSPAASSKTVAIASEIAFGRIAEDNSSVSNKALIVAIDGPSGAGEGAGGRAGAARLGAPAGPGRGAGAPPGPPRLGYRHIDTGAMYRAVAWRARQDGIDLGD